MASRSAGGPPANCRAFARHGDEPLDLIDAEHLRQGAGRGAGLRATARDRRRAAPPDRGICETAGSPTAAAPAYALASPAAPPSALKGADILVIPAFSGDEPRGREEIDIEIEVAPVGSTVLRAALRSAAIASRKSPTSFAARGLMASGLKSPAGRAATSAPDLGSGRDRGLNFAGSMSIGWPVFVLGESVRQQ